MSRVACCVCRVGVGVPFSPGAANGGQIAATLAVEKIKAAVRDNEAVLSKTFGGMFGWDEYWDHAQNAVR